jgi:hypothetical protein
MGAPPPPGDPAQKVAVPAILMIVFASIALAFGILGLVLMLVGSGMGAMFGGSSDAAAQMFSGAIGTVSYGISILFNGFVLFGAVQMKKLANYNLALIAAVLCMLPCSVCCLINTPIGIWALVVLLDQGVKAAFTS